MILYMTEIKVPCVKLDERLWGAVCVFHTPTKVLKATLGDVTDVTYSVSGETNTYPIGEDILVPGDYAFYAESDTPLDNLYLLVESDPITNEHIMAALTGLAKSLALEPSHVFNYPAKSSPARSGLLKKIHESLAVAHDSLAVIQTSLDMYKDTVMALQTEKGSDTVHVSEEELNSLLREKEDLYNKLQCAENHIEELETVNKDLTRWSSTKYSFRQ